MCWGRFRAANLPDPLVRRLFSRCPCFSYYAPPTHVHTQTHTQVPATAGKAAMDPRSDSRSGSPSRETVSPAEEGEWGQECDWDTEGMGWSWDDTGQSEAEPRDGDPQFTPASSPFPSSSGESGREHLHIPALSPGRGTTCLQTQPGNTRQQTQQTSVSLDKGLGTVWPHTYFCS